MILELRRRRQRLGERRSCGRRKKEVTGQLNIASGHPLDKPCSSKVKSHSTRNVLAQGESPDGEDTKQMRLDPGTWGTDSKRSVLVAKRKEQDPRRGCGPPAQRNNEQPLGGVWGPSSWQPSGPPRTNGPVCAA